MLLKTTEIQNSNSDQHQLTDSYLLQLVATRNVDAYEVLYERHAMTIYGLILRIVREARVAEDLLQDVFWKIWRSAQQFDGSGAATAWMFQIGRNSSLDELRRRKSRPQANEWVEVEDAYCSLAIEYPSAEFEAEYLFNQQEIIAALSQLPQEQKCCIELAYFEGLTHSEIRDRLNIPKGTVKSRLRRGLEKLEMHLRKAGYQ